MYLFLVGVFILQYLFPFVNCFLKIYLFFYYYLSATGRLPAGSPAPTYLFHVYPSVSEHRRRSWQSPENIPPTPLTNFSEIEAAALIIVPQDFLIQYRINKACGLLRSTSMPIMQIAHLVGYHNQFHFTRAFKNLMNLPPQEWRKRNKT